MRISARGGAHLEDAERERAAIRRAALVALGAEGDDLTDTERLLAVDDEDADEAQIHAAAGKACTTSAVSAATRTA
ncbi:hypothetical protein ACWGMA_24885 [Streptomyces asiaticus]